MQTIEIIEDGPTAEASIRAQAPASDALIDALPDLMRRHLAEPPQTATGRPGDTPDAP